MQPSHELYGLATRTVVPIGFRSVKVTMEKTITIRGIDYWRSAKELQRAAARKGKDVVSETLPPIEKPEWWTSDHWSTPWEIVRKLEEEFGEFDLDPCCRDETAKAARYYTKQHNGLGAPWSGKVFMNPPYSRPGPWLEKAYQAVTKEAADLVVALLPVRTDTRWFHQHVWGKAEIRFIKGRIKWLGWQGTPIPNPKDPSMFAVYRRPNQMHEHLKALEAVGASFTLSVTSKEYS